MSDTGWEWIKKMKWMKSFRSNENWKGSALRMIKFGSCSVTWMERSFQSRIDFFFARAWIFIFKFSNSHSLKVSQRFSVPWQSIYVNPATHGAFVVKIFQLVLRQIFENPLPLKRYLKTCTFIEIWAQKPIYLLGTK